MQWGQAAAPAPSISSTTKAQNVAFVKPAALHFARQEILGSPLRLNVGRAGAQRVGAISESRPAGEARSTLATEEPPQGNLKKKKIGCMCVVLLLWYLFRNKKLILLVYSVYSPQVTLPLDSCGRFLGSFLWFESRFIIGINVEQHLYCSSINVFI